MNDPTTIVKTPTAAPVVIYTTPYCGYCTSAKRLLDRLGIAFDEVDLSRDSALRRRLSDDNDGYRTVPMIYLEGRFIGGYDELHALDRKGGLGYLRRSA